MPPAAGADAPQSSEGGCGSPGWREASFAWNDLGYGEVRAGGFHYCYPPGWEEIDGALRYVAEAPEVWALLAVGGIVDLSHERTLQRLRDARVCPSPSNNADHEYLEIGGWPALQQTYTGQTGVCGECTNPAPSPPFHAADTMIATGDYFVSLTGMSSAAAGDGQVSDMLAIGRTVTADNVGDIDAGALDRELASLGAAPLPQCP